MLERVLEFSERQVKDVMVPRPEVTALEISTPMAEILQIVETTRYTRFPVYQGVLNNVIGILHGKDLMPYLHHPQTLVSPAAEKAGLHSGHREARQLHSNCCKTRRPTWAWWWDEHGGVEGIVTIEDLIEQIVGEIQDEHDVEVDFMVPHSDGSILIDSGISIRELNERLSLNVPESAHYVTLAGFLLTRTGRLPREGEELISKALSSVSSR